MTAAELLLRQAARCDARAEVAERQALHGPDAATHAEIARRSRLWASLLRSRAARLEVAA